MYVGLINNLILGEVLPKFLNQCDEFKETVNKLMTPILTNKKQTFSGDFWSVIRKSEHILRSLIYNLFTVSPI